MRAEKWSILENSWVYGQTNLLVDATNKFTGFACTFTHNVRIERALSHIDQERLYDAFGVEFFTIREHRETARAVSAAKFSARRGKHRSN